MLQKHKGKVSQLGASTGQTPAWVGSALGCMDQLEEMMITHMSSMETIVKKAKDRQRWLDKLQLTIVVKIKKEVTKSPTSQDKGEFQVGGFAKMQKIGLQESDGPRKSFKRDACFKCGERERIKRECHMRGSGKVTSVKQGQSKDIRQ